MARRVHQMRKYLPPVARAIFETHGLRLDRDAALALDLYIVDHLLAHLARFEPAARLDQPVGERRLTVIDMSDDREIADMRQRGHAWRNIRTRRRRINARCVREQSGQFAGVPALSPAHRNRCLPLSTLPPVKPASVSVSVKPVCDCPEYGVKPSAILPSVFHYSPDFTQSGDGIRPPASS
jgi:hypothetical protein